jgi:hypothetical protein
MGGYGFKHKVEGVRITGPPHQAVQSPMLSCDANTPSDRLRVIDETKVIANAVASRYLSPKFPPAAGSYFAFASVDDVVEHEKGECKDFREACKAAGEVRSRAGRLDEPHASPFWLFMTLAMAVHDLSHGCS